MTPIVDDDYPEARHDYEAALKDFLVACVANGRLTPFARPRIVCLCGSTRFYESFQKANYEETMKGSIVLSVGFYPHSTTQAYGEDIGITKQEKEALDVLHKRKIDIADEVLVLNVGRYIGDSTRSEIEYAMKLGKSIRYLEP